MDYRLTARAPAVPGALALDAAQRSVVEHRSGPLLVLAGPGTGKTTTLVESVADRVASGVKIDNILVLTFGQRAAGQLRDRIATRLTATIREPIARTFHSYAFGVLRLAADAQLPPPRLLSGTEQDIMLRELLAGDLESGATSWPASVQPALRTRGFAGELRDLLLRAIERDIDSAELVRLGRNHHRPDWEAAGRFLHEYLQVTSLERPGAYDAAELIGAAIDVLEGNPELLAQERSRRRHIFVDEYQDTDPAQAYLLSLLAAGAQEVILVGDPDQSIYSFRGADADAIRRAGDLFAPHRKGGSAGDADLPTLALNTCRRAGTGLVEAGRRVAAGLPGPVTHRGLLAAGPPGRLDVALFRSRTEEAAAVAAALRRAHLDDGVAWSKMAVIVRSTVRSAAVLRRALLVAGVPVTVAGQDLPLAEQNSVSQLLSALRCVGEPAALTDEVAESLLLGPLGDADSLYLRRLRRHLRNLAVAAGDDPDAEVVAAALRDPGLIATLPARLRRPLQRVERVLSQAQLAVAAGQSAEDVLWSLWHATGLATHWQRQSAAGGPIGAAADRNLDAVIELFAAAARLADRLPGASIAVLSEHISAQQIPGDAGRSSARDADAVQILTAHASKGLEWDVVCVAGVQEGVWPDLRRRGSLLGAELLVDVAAGRGEVSGLSTTPLLADERRLFYVAVTRARTMLLVTAAQGQEEQPSRFLDELDPIDGDRPLSAVRRPLHLPGLVAELRSVVTASDVPASDAAAHDAAHHAAHHAAHDAADRRQHAAALLAELARAGVSGADPDQWWGMAELSDERGVVADDDPVHVSPSHVDSYLTCAMKTFLESAGGSDEPTAKAALGSIVHEIAELADVDADLVQLEEMMSTRWPALDWGAAWYGRQQRTEASTMLSRLRTWLDVERGELQLVARERAFAVDVDGDGRTVLRGAVDRLERDPQGRAVVVDFKTSGSKVKADELDQHPQLSAYQLAAELGAFTDVADGASPSSAEAGGAWLVQLGATGKPITQKQPALAQTASPEWVRDAVAQVAALQRGARFDATVNPYCQTCAVRRMCPARQNRQVTQ